MSQKTSHVWRLACSNFVRRERILTFFGRNITDKVSNEETLYCATSMTCAFALPGKMEKHENCSLKCCSSKCMYYCQNSTSRCLISSIFLTHNSTQPTFLPWRFGFYQRPSSEEVCSIPLPVLATIVMRRGMVSQCWFVLLRQTWCTWQEPEEELNKLLLMKVSDRDRNVKVKMLVVLK